MKSHLESYPSPLQINYFWNLGFLLGITIILQIITGILSGLAPAWTAAKMDPVDALRYE
jgi:ABC-type lipoprotein release transport system permease subunit